MNTARDFSVTKDTQSGVIKTGDNESSIGRLREKPVTSNDESALDLSQRVVVPNLKDRNSPMSFVNDWTNHSLCVYTDDIDDDFPKKLTVIDDNSPYKELDVKQALTDQIKSQQDIKPGRSSDNSSMNQSQMDFYEKRTKRITPLSHTVHEIQPILNNSPVSLSNFLWSKYLSLIDERSVSEKFFDHYLASIKPGFEVDMKLEYCYDTKSDLYWLTQIKFISHHLIRLHYVGLPENDTSNDVWAHIYDRRCHPIGWCKENSKLMIPPPPIITKGTAQEISLNNNTNHDKQLSVVKQELNDDNEKHQTPINYLFDKGIGRTPIEQLEIGMILELQNSDRPWTVWFVRIINNQGGRLHLRYITNTNDNSNAGEQVDDSYDIHIFYLDYRVHAVGWASNNPCVYNYDIPMYFKITIDNKQSIIDACLEQGSKQVFRSNLFEEQMIISKHKFVKGMKLEVFDPNSQNVCVGRIGHIHNEYYFDVIIDGHDESENESSFVAHANHPYILPPEWAAGHKLALMKGRGNRQSDDYWSTYTEKNGVSDLASDRCFNIMKLGVHAGNRIAPGMKMEMIYTFKGKDCVFSVTLLHITDHLMWLKIDNTSLFDDEYLFYHVVPINSLNIFPVGWAKFNGFQLITPIEYKIQINTYEQNRYDLFSPITHHPEIPRVFASGVYLLTIYVNIRCFSGPHFCSSRLARIPSQFGPGPYVLVLIDMFHHLLSASSANSQRALRRLDHQISSEKKINMTTVSIKLTKKSGKLMRNISIPNEPDSVHRYLRHVCTQLECCANLISLIRIDNNCSDKCHILTNMFAFSVHPKNKRTQLRVLQNRPRKKESLLSHFQAPSPLTLSVSSPIVEDIPQFNELSVDVHPTKTNTNATRFSGHISSAPSDRQTRGRRVHFEPKTHTMIIHKKRPQTHLTPVPTNTRKQETNEISTMVHITSSLPAAIGTPSKRTRLSKRSRPISPTDPVPISPFSALNTFSSNIELSSSHSKLKQTSQLLYDHNPLLNGTSLLVTHPANQRNPMTWTVDDVYQYLDESDCSFVLKTVKEQEIDGAALLLIDNLGTAQDVLNLKLGPALKLWNIVEKLRQQVMETYDSLPSLKRPRLLTR